MIKSNIHIGEKIGLILSEKKLSKAKFAKLLEVKPQSVDYLLKRKSIDTDTLYKISILLDYDFFDFFRMHERDFEQRNFDIIPAKAKVLIELELEKEDMEKLNLRQKIINKFGTFRNKTPS
jgi:transcriptional regulator with XRE-family HTH domain